MKIETRIERHDISKVRGEVATNVVLKDSGELYCVIWF